MLEIIVITMLQQKGNSTIIKSQNMKVKDTTAMIVVPSLKLIEY